jgi:hypothetical protein
MEGADDARIALADLFEAFGKVDVVDIAQDNNEGFHKLQQVKGLSKSRYTAFCQCPKILWLKVFKPAAATEDPDRF